jgi:hypothetical protein
LIWSGCLLNYAKGTLGVTTDRLLFVQDPGIVHVNRSRKERCAVAIGRSLTTPDGDSGAGTIVVTFMNERNDFHGLNPTLAKQIADTLTSEADAATAHAGPQEPKSSQLRTYPPRLRAWIAGWLVGIVAMVLIAQAIPGIVASIVFAAIIIIGIPFAAATYSTNRICRHCGYTPKSITQADFPTCQRCGRNKWE